MSVIQMRSVHKRFGDVSALAGVDLEIAQGELVAVLGPNGAGKTTAFELILGLAHPTSGQVATFGHRPGDRAAVVRTGAMLQNAGLPENVTVAELVQLVAASYPQALAMEDVLRRAGLDNRSDRRVTVLSGGERQRLLLAIAIVGSPDLLLLDEPTAAMDAESRRAFWAEAAGAVDEGTTLVFATHDLAEADAVARRVVVLKDGRVLADTTPTEMKRLFSSKVVTFRTSPDALETVTLPNGDHLEVDYGSGRVQVHTSTPEMVVSALVQDGHPVHDLLVSEAGLEEAFVSLVGSQEAS